MVLNVMIPGNRSIADTTVPQGYDPRVFETRPTRNGPGAGLIFIFRKVAGAGSAGARGSAREAVGKGRASSTSTNKSAGSVGSFEKIGSDEEMEAKGWDKVVKPGK